MYRPTTSCLSGLLFTGDIRHGILCFPFCIDEQRDAPPGEFIRVLLRVLLDLFPEAFVDRAPVLVPGDVRFIKVAEKSHMVYAGLVGRAGKCGRTPSSILINCSGRSSQEGLTPLSWVLFVFPEPFS